MREHKDTRIHLVIELEKLPPSPGVLEMIQEAKAGEYHDFKNQKYACGKVAVSGKLRVEAALYRPGSPVNEQLISLARQVEDGDYDEEMDEEDKVEMKKWLPKEMLGIMKL